MAFIVVVVVIVTVAVHVGVSEGTWYYEVSSVLSYKHVPTDFYVQLTADRVIFVCVCDDLTVESKVTLVM